MEWYHVLWLISIVVSLPSLIHYTRKIGDVDLVDMIAIMLASILPFGNIAILLTIMDEPFIIFKKYEK